MSKSFRKRAFRAYQKVKTLKPARSLFDLSHEKLFTGDMGKLYPICAMEMSPGDTFHIWNEIVTRMQPLNAPILHQIKLYTHWFFVPYRILWDEWTNFITGGVEGEYGGNTRGDVPSEVDPQLPRWNPSDTSVGSLWDYLGFPTGVVPAGALPLDFVRRCYNRIWNEYYRDETLQDEVDETNESILNRNWRKDYFTSALVSQQRGVAPAMPLSGIIASPVTSLIASLNYISAQSAFAVSSKIPVGGVYHYIFTGHLRIYANEGTFSENDVAYFNQNKPNWSITATVDSKDIPLSNSTSGLVVSTDEFKINSIGDLVRDIDFVYNAVLPYDLTSTSGTYSSASCSVSTSYASVDLKNAGTYDVKDLRVAFQIQRWLELANRGGVRYTEFLRSFFGVSPRDDRLQRPEYIGGSKSPIVISEVLQTSSTDSEPTPQGNMAGHGIGADRTYIGSYTATEFGIVMGLLSVMPEAKYQQGINRQWLRRTKFDFLFPQFTGLSEQAIEEAEIYATASEEDNRRVFGFNEVYDELRSMPSQICGKMRSTFDYWHLGRKFDSAPALNSDFITCNPSKRIFAVTDEDGFIFDVGNIIRAVRPIPKYGTPKGV